MKEKLRKVLESDDLEAAVSLAREDRKTLTQLVRLAYDKETLVGRRAVKAVGLIAKALVQQDVQFLREQVRRLLWSLNDESGGIGWAAPELIGEIISADPEEFKEFISPLTTAYDAEERIFRPGIVYALSRIADKSPELAAVYQRVIISSLVDVEPATRFYGLELVSKTWQKARERGIWSEEYSNKVKDVVRHLKSDSRDAWIFQNSDFSVRGVGEKAIEVYKKLI